MKFALPDLCLAAALAHLGVWEVLFPRGGFYCVARGRYGPLFGPGPTLKLVWSPHHGGRWVVFRDDQTGRPIDAVQFAYDYIVRDWDGARDLILDLVVNLPAESEGQTGAGGRATANPPVQRPLWNAKALPVVMPTAFTPSAPIIIYPLEGLARRMTDTGVAVDGRGLSAAQCDLGAQRLRDQLLATRESDGRLHPRWQPGAQPTGRWGCSPYIFNLPKALRRFLVPGPGLALLEVDLKAAGFVAVATLAGETPLRRFASAGDPYAALFEDCFARMPTPTEREQTKRVVQCSMHGGALPRGVPMVTSAPIARRVCEAIAPFVGFLAGMSGSDAIVEPFSCVSVRPNGSAHSALALLEHSLVQAHVDRCLLAIDAMLDPAAARIVAMCHDSVLVECAKVDPVLEARVQAAFEEPNRAGQMEVAFHAHTAWRTSL